jgi:beta-galactosidase
VDAVRLPKEIYFAHRVIQNETPDVHVLGHWSYPADHNMVKTVYVIANTGSVELFLNGKSLGAKSDPDHGYIFAFEQVAFAPGTLRAVVKLNGKVAAEHVLSTAGAPAGLKLTPIVGPEGWRADGADIVLIDVEVVDAKGHRCPTDDARVDFAIAGPGVWRGGYNSGKTDSTNNLWLNTELGINRAAVRATREAGVVTVTAKREGLTGAKAELRSQTIDMRGKV